MQSLSLPTNQPLTAQQLSICDELATGAHLKAAALDHGLTLRALQRMRLDVPAFDSAVVAARAMHIDELVDRLEELATTTPDVQRARLLCDNIKWVAPKLSPRQYGERLDVMVEHRVDLTAAMALAKARLVRPRCDPDDTLDGEFVALPSFQGSGAIDSESIARAEDTPAADDLPDIFT